MTMATLPVCAYTADDVLKNWQGHRRLTRKTIEAFPEDKLFTFSVGGMRPFGDLAAEFIGMAVPVAEGVATGKWEQFKGTKAASKAELLELWDAQTVALDEKFPNDSGASFWRGGYRVWAVDDAGNCHDSVCDR